MRLFDVETRLSTEGTKTIKEQGTIYFAISAAWK
jgi:hypothetical protein